MMMMMMMTPLCVRAVYFTISEIRCTAIRTVLADVISLQVGEQVFLTGL